MLATAYSGAYLAANLPPAGPPQSRTASPECLFNKALRQAPNEAIRMLVRAGLPFATLSLNSASSSPSLSSLSSMANGGYMRTSLGGGSDGRTGSFTRNWGDAESSAAVRKDAMMVELLSGAALIEAAKCEIMDWDTLQVTKKEHSTLSARLVSLRRSLAVETKLRDSAAKLVRLSGPDSPEGSPTRPSAVSRPRVTRRQAEAQLALAQEKLDTVEQGVTRIATREAELHAKLLAHTAGVLSAALRNRDSVQAATDSTAVPQLDALASTRSSAAHLYASHGRTMNGHDDGRASRLEQELAEQKAKTSELAEQAAQLERVLDDTKEQARVEMDRLGDELARLQAAAASRSEESMRQVQDLEGEVDFLRSDLAEAAAEVDDLRRRLAAIPSDAGQPTRAELEEELELARGEVKQLTDELEEAQGELESLNKVFEDRIAAAEQEGARQAREEAAAAAGSAETRQRGAVIQAIGDVLRRHRMRPVLGASLRELPAFDDTAERDDLADYLSSTLDAHFERLTALVDGLNGGISTLSHERDSAANELEALRSQAREEAVDEGAAIATNEADLAAARAGEQAARDELAQARQRLDSLEEQLREVEQDQVAVRELWRDLPRDQSSTPFSTAALVARVKALSAERGSLRQQIEEWERDRAQSAADQSDAQHADSSRLRELEERVELSAQKEVSMLERLNELTEALEATRGERRKLESQMASLEQDKAQLELELEAAREKTTAAAAVGVVAVQPAPLGSSEDEVQELRDQIADLEEELSDAQKREQKTRASLLEELGQVQSEVSSLKTSLRQAQRKAVGVKA
ncbi:hypothetical protein JCM3774_003055 [Rhodotorula dairenensis]